MSHKAIQWFIIILVALYSVLIFTVIGIDDLMDDDDSEGILNILLYVEIIILALFVLEISLTGYSQGWKNYFKDGWLVFDAIVIVLSIGFVILDLSVDFGNSFKTISSSLRGIFRFVRIFLLIRKLTTFKKIKTTGGIKTAAEKIVETLQHLQEQIEVTELLQGIDYAMEMISSNRLYDPVFNKKGDENDKWFDNYNYGKKNQSDDKLKLQTQKSKKKINRIRPGSDKILATIPNKALIMFEKVNNIDFNCFELQKITKGQELSYLLIYLFEINDLYTELSINPKTLKNFALAIQNGYQPNPYHNSLHAFDVTQTVNVFLKSKKFQELAQISDLELCSMYLSAAYHDVGHPGQNNPYLINSQHDLAIKYNDIAVLENFHLASSFELMMNEELDVCANFSSQNFQKFREMSINMVLATDMSKHFTDIAKAKGRLSQDDFDITSKDKAMCMELILHAADVSNPIKPWDVCFQWTEKVMEEFWDQGDKEKAEDLPVTYLCDRYTTNMAKSQGGFIDFVVKPLYEVLANFLPEVSNILSNFENNKDNWSKLIPVYEEKLKALNDKKTEIEEED
ncbi:hypothetical protein PPERSA_05013 [Pseudocohnilembus persalinus]|uniref:Phosphodiesterase n=1 Tax=Pseudocohnilembus persalinus TaxID=266149 RepID=A0A0V0QWM1_PSEPJ|nr:hypothetical protein PPERSA_05013 [Pseudocohnilembus persalinus]|eukprot:KRX06400.1 hypothetical protein PPERSA_05013 [Pseudocohnilembus persalinus]